MSDLHGLGKLIATDQQRDAIHIAIAPVVAGERLDPGERIGFIDRESSTVGLVPEADQVGIVDPYLKRFVVKDEKFWMFLFPNTIATLRHTWTHPAFDEEKPAIAAKPEPEPKPERVRDLICPECPEYGYED